MLSVSELLDSMLVWDAVWPWEPWCGNDLDHLLRLHDNGWNHVSLTVAGDNHNISEAVQRIAHLRREIAARSPSMVLVGSCAEINTAKEAGQLAVSLHLEGTRCFERNLDMVDTFYQLGIRHTLIAFNVANSAGGGCAEEDGGLTKFGRELIRAMERVGMLLDLSHTGCRTSLEAMEMATRPVIFSHSNAAAVTSHWRNLIEPQIRACAATGGVVGISGSSGYLGDADASTDSLFRHLDHIVELVGPHHVGFGFDIVFDPAPLNEWVKSRPAEWPEATSPDWRGFSYMTPPQLEELIERMVGAGYNEDAIRAIGGGNFLRVCSDVWK